MNVIFVKFSVYKENFKNFLIYVHVWCFKLYLFFFECIRLLTWPPFAPSIPLFPPWHQVNVTNTAVAFQGRFGSSGAGKGTWPDIFANYTLLNIKYSHNAPETASLWPLLMGQPRTAGDLF